MTVTINGTTGIAGVDGSAATPAVQGVDTNTGVFYGTDIVAISTGGTERMRVNASGNVGIGTTAPSKQLNIYAASNSLQIQSVVRNANTGTGVAAIGFNVAGAAEGDYTQAGIGLLRGVANGSGSLVFYNKGSGTASDFTTADEKMRIASSGNVGIGTTSPVTTLQVTTSGGAALPATTGTTPSTGELIRLRTGSDAAGGIGTIGLATNQMWIQATDATALGAVYDLLLNPNGGSVGIGTTGNSVLDQVGAGRPLLVSASDTVTTIAGSKASIVIGNSSTTTGNTSQLSFAAITGASANYYASAAINWKLRQPQFPASQKLCNLSQRLINGLTILKSAGMKLLLKSGSLLMMSKILSHPLPQWVTTGTMVSMTVQS